jgi:hypothetical protein
LHVIHLTRHAIYSYGLPFCLQSFHGIDLLQPDQQTSAPTTPGMAGQAENKGTQYPMNSLLRQLHMERMQRLKSLVGSSLSSTPH